MMSFNKGSLAYLAKDVLSKPMKASAAPPTAVFLQPKRSVNMLTTGEQKKIMPMAKAPTQAAEEEEKGDISTSVMWKCML